MEHHMDSPLEMNIITYWGFAEFQLFKESSQKDIASRFLRDKSEGFYAGMAKGMNTVYAILKEYISKPEKFDMKAKMGFGKANLLDEDLTEEGKLNIFKHWSALVCAYVSNKLIGGPFPRPDRVVLPYDVKATDKALDSYVEDFENLSEESKINMSLAFRGDQSDDFYEGLLRAYVITLGYAEENELSTILADVFYDHSLFLSREVKVRREKTKTKS